MPAGLCAVRGTTSLPLGRRNPKRSARFKMRTATSWEGFSPTHYQHLCDHGLMLLSALYQCAEVVGAFPEAIAATSYVLIPKPPGGPRPIGLLSSAYRVWAKARSVHAASWETSLGAPCLAATSCLDEVWTQCVTREQATAQGHHTVSAF